MSSFLHAVIWLGSVVPRVDDPLPHRIGLGFPFTLAGLGGMAGSIACPNATAARRDRLAALLTSIFFWGGVAVYGFAVAHQLLSKS